jgi:arylsulfatase A-like enzyme
MPKRPNILFLMTDQMQGAALRPGHPAITPNLDRLARRGVRIDRAYTPNPVCSPARACLMTGLLPHAHGVLEVTHTTDDDQSVLRTKHPHWMQSLAAAGFRGGYFGKWHLERSKQLQNFGWEMFASENTAALKDATAKHGRPATKTFAERLIETPGYKSSPFYRVTDQDPRHKFVGVVTTLAEDFMRDALKRDEPWCCFVSCLEPHDPFICGKAAFDLYDVDALPLPATLRDRGERQPNIYRKSARVYAGFSDHDHRMAAACYYASITEIDQQYGRLLDLLESEGRLDDTLVVFTSDHGEQLGAHGLYCKNIGAFERAYHIPMLLAGPGVARGGVADARVGLHDLAPTLCELAGVPWTDNGQSRSFAPLLRVPLAHAGEFTAGYAEYFGTRVRFLQRVVWDGPWKLVFNGFDFDELYNLDEDPEEADNRIDDPACADIVRRLFARMWEIVRRTDDPLIDTHYPPIRVAPFGPFTADEASGAR